MTGRLLDRLAVATAATAAGLTFAAAFDDATRLMIAVPIIAALSAAPAPRWWRPLLALAGGITVAVLVLRQPVTAAALLHLEGWDRLGTVAAGGLGRMLRLTLPLPAELALIPVLLAALAAAAGTTLIRRRPGQLSALVPATVVGFCGIVAAGVHAAQTAPVVLGLAAVALLVVRASAAPVIAAVAAVALAATPLLWALDPPARATTDLRDRFRAPVRVAASANLLDRVGGWLSTPGRQMFRAEGDPVRRWRLAVLDHYDGDTWTSTAEFTPAGLGVPPAGAATGATLSQRVELISLEGPYLPAADRPVRVSAPVSAVDTTDGVLVADGPLAPGTRYAVTSAHRSKPAQPVLAPAATSGELAVPDRLLAPVRALLQRAPLRPDMLPGERARAVEWYLRSHHRNIVGAPSAAGISALAAFLRAGGSGTTVQFGAAFALAMRADGIPARLVVGFQPPSVRGSSVTVLGRDARVWVELKYQQTGWVTYDPTPPAGTAGAPIADDPPPSRAPATGPAALAAPPPPGQVDLRAPPGAVPAIWALVLAAAAYLLAVLLAPAIRRAARRRRRGSADERIVRAWHDVLEEYAPTGGPALRTLTPARLRDMISELPGGGTAPANPALERLAGRALYSPQPGTETDGDQAWRSATELRRIVRSARPRRQRWLSRLHPARLRAPHP